ncbi:MAG: serine/threonine-protein kinase [Verrucomicrobia bacterium]|nr:serine/threonine-protein kinase [Verrucomicrobiota bacterium]
MSEIRFQCDACQHAIVANAATSGSEMHCPKCQKTLTVPAPPPPAANAEELPPVSHAGPTPTPPHAADLPKIKGYEILTKLGEGGMGAVYKAREPMLNRLVAIKVMSRRYGDDATFVARFIREAAAAANLSHRNMVRVFTAGESNQIRYIAMEFVEGRTLSQHIQKHERLDAREAVAVTIYVAQALQHAWNKARLIHRDIKPENIFLSYGGEVKVGDLGLAKSLDETDAVLTTTGVTMGSPHYISPEQARAMKDMDFRADIYSLGCTLFHMLTGRPPFDAEDTFSIMMKHVKEPPPAITEIWPECPPSLAALLGRMLTKDRNARPQSYEKLIAELVAIHDGLKSSSSPSPISPVEPTKSFMAKLIPVPRRKLAGIAGVVAGAGVAVALAGLWWWFSREAGDEGSGKGQAAGIQSADSPAVAQSSTTQLPTPPTTPSSLSAAPAQVPESSTVSAKESTAAIAPAGERAAADMPPNKPKTDANEIPAARSVITDRRGNLKGERSRQFVDIVEASVERRGNEYVLSMTMAAPFPPQDQMQGKPTTLTWFIDLDRNPKTGQQSKGGFGRDYNIHLRYGETGWRPDFFKVSDVSKGAKTPRDLSAIRIEVNGTTARLRVPVSFIAGQTFDWFADAVCGGPKNPPRTSNPRTARATFYGSTTTR